MDSHLDRLQKRIANAIQEGRATDTAYPSPPAVFGADPRAGVGIQSFEHHLVSAMSRVTESTGTLRYVVNQVERQLASVNTIGDRLNKLVPVVSSIFAVGQVFADVKVASPLNDAVDYLTWYELGGGKQDLDENAVHARELIRSWNQESTVEVLNEIAQMVREVVDASDRATKLTENLANAAGLKRLKS